MVELETLTANEKVAEFFKANHLAKAHKDKADSLREAIINLFPEGKNLVDGYEVAIKSTSTDRLDTKALKADLPKVYDKYTKSSPSIRLTVKMVGDIGSDEG